MSTNDNYCYLKINNRCKFETTYMNYHFALFKYLILINQALYVHSLSQKWLGKKPATHQPKGKSP